MTSLLPIQYVTPHSITSISAAKSTLNTEQHFQQHDYQFQQRWYNTTSRMTRDALTTSLPAEGVLPAVTVAKPRSTPNGNNRLAYVDALVDVNALVIEMIWQLNPAAPVASANNTRFNSKNNAVVPLRTFIQEVLKRSRTTYSTLQTALFYLFRSRPEITNYLARMQQQQQQQNNWEYAYINCGRRMFLASLVVASKFVQDKTYRNSAWAKIAGLPVSEVNAAERIFLNIIDYRLYISQPKFEQWHHLLHMYVERKTLNQPTNLHDLSTLPFAPTRMDYVDTRPQQNYGWTMVLSPTSFLPASTNCECQPEGQSKKRKSSCSSSTSYPPVLSMSLPSSIHSSPMQTPTQISPVRMNNGTSVFNWNSPTNFDHHQRSIMNPSTMNKKRKFTVIESHPRSYNISNVRQQPNRFYP